MSAALQNIYYERKVATPRPCYICKRPTQTVLATLKTEDFLYTCDGHLVDAGFATLISAPPTIPPGPSAEDVKKVVSEYQAREASRAKEKDGAIKDKDKGDADNKSTADTGKKPAPAPAPASAPAAPVPTASPAQTHRKYALHRQIFDIRKGEMRKREMGAKAKEVGKGLPQVPRGVF